jgi:hypothetical protein
VRIDERPSQPSALEGIGIAGSNVLATELEMLRSRQLVKEVADSLSLRLGVQQPRFARASRVVIASSRASVSRPMPSRVRVALYGRRIRPSFFSMPSATLSTAAFPREGMSSGKASRSISRHRRGICPRSTSRYSPQMRRWIRYWASSTCHVVIARPTWST